MLDFSAVRARALGFLASLVSGEGGQAAIVMALTSTVLVGSAALTLDVGMIVVEKRQMQTAADAAVLAAARYLPATTSARETAAIDEAIEIASANGYAITQENIEFSSTSATNDTITIHFEVTRALSLAPVLGIDTATPAVSAVAQVGTIGGGTGAMPFGIEDQSLVFGSSYCLKLGTGNCGGANKGNFHALDIDDTGNSSASQYEEKIRNGSSTKVQIGDIRPVNTGNMAGPTRQGVGCQGNNGRITGNTQSFEDVVRQNADGTVTILDWDSPRLVLVPIVDFDGNVSAEVLGFAGFFIEGCSGNDSIVGRFIQVVRPNVDWTPITGDNNFGGRSVRLVG
jgi:Flp pilus assembly protein TadG